MINAAEKICDQLNGEWNGKQGQACCPVCGTLSLSVGVGSTSGKLLVYCHSRCISLDVIAKLKKMKLWPRRKRKKGKNSKPIKREKTEYEYAFGRQIMLPDARADAAWEAIIKIEQQKKMEKN